MMDKNSLISYLEHVKKNLMLLMNDHKYLTQTAVAYLFEKMIEEVDRMSDV